MKRFGLMILIFFLLIFVNTAVMQLKEKVSLITILEISSIAILIILYYSIIKIETRLASKIIEKRLMKVEKRFEKIEKRFDEDIRELKELLKRDHRRLAKK